MGGERKLHTISFSTSGGMCGEVEKGNFTPLVSQHLVVCVVKWRKKLHTVSFSTSGGMCGEERKLHTASFSTSGGMGGEAE